MIILDTNVLSALMRDAPDQNVASWMDRQPHTSIWTNSITILEIQTGLQVMPEGKRFPVRRHDGVHRLHRVNHRWAYVIVNSILPSQPKVTALERQKVVSDLVSFTGELIPQIQRPEVNAIR